MAHGSVIHPPVLTPEEKPANPVYLPSASSVPNEHLYEVMVGLGGGLWRGTFPAFKSRNGRVMEALALFESPKTGTTLALPLSKVNARNVRARIAASDREFEVGK